MNVKRFAVLVGALVLGGLLLVACGGTETVTETVEVEVTRIVEVEVPAEGGGAAEPVTFAGGGDTLQQVLDRGTLKCGTTAGASPGFAFLEADGTWSGQDADYCRVIAAAVLSDKDAVEFRSTTGTDRFPVLQSGEVDVLVRQTTWTLSRDTSLGFNFVATIFYDGQGMMVRKDSGITSLEGLDGGSVCVATGTTTEKNLADVFRLLDIQYEAVVFDDQGDTTRSAFEEGRCDGYTTDKSGLVSSFALFDNPDDYMILAETMSKEPLGPLVRHGDDNWFDIVQWSVFCTFQAEELGITSANVDDMLGSDDPAILNTLGVEGDLGQAMGLNNDFCYQIIKQMGNYGEIYDKNLGPDTQFNLPRGANSLWTQGGLLYSPPFR
ncbi:MAG: amino acid ABC transporter substrate-binding protein [Ardenticatenaceae bacterium]|nr:amino acid ABC transporter substrate-binding protein [Ardenticatenaceae bacterium]